MALLAAVREKKKLIFVTPGPLLPITNGQRSTAYQLICELSKLLDLECVLMTPEDTPQVQVLTTINALKQLGVPVNVVPTRPWTTASSMCRHLVGSLSSFLEQRLFRRPERMPINPEDSVLFFGSTFDPTAQTVGKIPASQHFFFPADSIALFQSNINTSSMLGKALKGLKLSLAKVLEQGVTSLYDLSFYVSPRDCAYAKSNCKVVRAQVVPIGTRPPAKAKVYEDSLSKRLIFTGVMNYGPNLEAAKFLLTKVMPGLIGHGISLTFAGLNPPTELFNLAKPFGALVRITGEVPSIEEEIIGSDLYISPLFSGAGSKNKILTALGCGVPVIGTAESFSGFSSQPPGTVIVNGEAKDFKEAVLRFLDLSLADKSSLGRKARDFVSNNCSWESSAKVLLQNITGSKYSECSTGPQDRWRRAG